MFELGEERETDKYSDIDVGLLIRNRALCFTYYKYECGFILRSSELVKNSKKSKCWLLTLKSQTLTGLIFKCDLNFGKMNADSCSGGWN